MVEKENFMEKYKSKILLGILTPFQEWNQKAKIIKNHRISCHESGISDLLVYAEISKSKAEKLASNVLRTQSWSEIISYFEKFISEHTIK